MAPWVYHDKPKVARLNVTNAAAIGTIMFARKQIGKPFDNGALWSFLHDQAEEPPQRQWRDPATWFCSELLIRACEVGGVFPWRLAVTKTMISPGDSLMLLNPFMAADNIAEFVDG